MQTAQLLYISLGVILALEVILGFLIFRLQSHYNSLTKGASKKDLLSALNLFIAKSENNQKSIDDLKESLEHEIKENKFHLQKVGFKRFNPFTDTGGNQSFILTLLDEIGNGIVISSLHSRENTRVYAKSVSEGEPDDQVLSKDEQQLIKETLKK